MAADRPEPRWMYCNCSEGFVSDGKTPEGKRRLGTPHDCSYISARNALMPEAHRIARIIAREGGLEVTAAFSYCMDMLALRRIYGKDIEWVAAFGRAKERLAGMQIKSRTDLN